HVFSEDWVPLASYADVPYAPEAVGIDAGAPSALWSPRRIMTFIADHAGVYRVAFGASVANNAGLGSVAIANVQLEAAHGTEPVPYQPTTASRLSKQTNCPLPSGDLKAAFERHCDDGGDCYYELHTPFVINSESLRSGHSRL